jgi:hypothetical protein
MSNAVEAPSAFTHSLVNVSVYIDEVAVPEADTVLSAGSAAISKSLAMAPDAAHRAAASAAVSVYPGKAAQLPGFYLEATPLVSVTTQHSTLAQSAVNNPLFARSASASVASLINFPLYDLSRLTAQSASIALQWDIDALMMTSRQTSSYSMISDYIEVTQHLGDASETSTLGFRIEADNGELQARCIEPAFPSVLQEQFCDSFSSRDDGLLGITAASDTLTVSLPLSVLTPQLAADAPFSWLTLTHYHEELAYAAPALAIAQVAEQAGHYQANDNSPALHWDSEDSLLRIDPLPLDALSGGAIDAISSRYAQDTLIGGFLEIDPLHLSQTIGEQHYFFGEELRLIDNTGSILLRAKLPSVLFDNQLFANQGFNLFAPVLNVTSIETGRSDWLDAFSQHLSLDSDLLPELFLGFDLSTQALDVWTRSFSAPVNGVLSFAGPFVEVDEAAAPAPATFLLVLMGLASWTYLYRVAS